MFVKILLSLLLALYAYAYELPSVKIANTDEPKIILFNAKSVLVDEKLSYLLTWKTNNATKVTLTYIGDVAVDGNITITQEEYNNGAITLSASSKTSKHIDKHTINKVNTDLPAPIKFDKPQERQTHIRSSQRYYRPHPYRTLPRRAY